MKSRMCSQKTICAILSSHSSMTVSKLPHSFAHPNLSAFNIFSKLHVYHGFGSSRMWHDVGSAVLMFWRMLVPLSWRVKHFKREQSIALIAVTPEIYHCCTHARTHVHAHTHACAHTHTHIKWKPPSCWHCMLLQHSVSPVNIADSHCKRSSQQGFTCCACSFALCICHYKLLQILTNSFFNMSK